MSIAPDRLWRRCGAAAFEEIGVADLATVSLVTAALAGRRFRATLGGEWKIASASVERLANLRNPQSHFRNVNDSSNLMRRSMNADQEVGDLLKADAYFAIGIAINALSKPPLADLGPASRQAASAEKAKACERRDQSPRSK